MKTIRVLLFIPLLVLGLSAASCQSSTSTTASLSNPFAQCHTVGQCYLATTGTFKASQAAALEIAQNPDTPPSVKDAIKKAETTAEPVVLKLSDAYTLYRHVKVDLNTCAAGDTACKNDATSRLTTAEANVGKWLTEATPLVNDLLSLAGGDK